MVEVDPMLLIAAGSIAAGLAAAALCLRPSKSVQSKQAVSNSKVEAVASVKPKKKATKTAKKVSSAADSAAESESEIAALVADIGHVDLQPKSTKKTKESKSTGPSPADIAAAKASAKKAAEAEEVALKAQRKAEAAAEAAELVARILAEEEEAKKSKKAKETPEQRVARLERQKLAKVKKVEEEELSKTAAIQLAAVESKLVSTVSHAGAAPQPQHIDGWAVVEDKRKVKAKAVVAVAAVAESTGPAEPSQPADFVKTEISVESKKIGVIIGPKGVTLHGIQDATGADISTPKGERDNTAPIIITVSGPAEGVARAVKAINELCAKGYTKLLAGEDFKEGSIEVMPVYLSEIIGKGGANIRAIQDFTGVKLSIPQVARDHVLPVKIALAGNKDKVQVAKDIITELTKYFHTSITHPGQVHVEMDVPSVMFNYIIGSRGSEIKHIQGNFKVSVHIPNAESILKTVVIVGDPSGVKGAEKYIQKIIDQAIADKEHAEKMNDAWVDNEEEPGQEEWMAAYAHPSRAKKNEVISEESSSSSSSNGGNGSGNAFQLGAASTAAVAASASAWGASVLASSEGW